MRNLRQLINGYLHWVIEGSFRSAKLVRFRSRRELTCLETCAHTRYFGVKVRQSKNMFFYRGHMFANNRTCETNQLHLLYVLFVRRSTNEISAKYLLAF